jgi:hypothetical protein
MSELILTEVRRAKEAVDQARAYLDMAVDEYIDAAIFRLNAAQVELDAVLKKAKEVERHGKNRIYNINHSVKYLFS